MIIEHLAETIDVDLEELLRKEQDGKLIESLEFNCEWLAHKLHGDLAHLGIAPDQIIDGVGQLSPRDSVGQCRKQKVKRWNSPEILRGRTSALSFVCPLST